MKRLVENFGFRISDFGFRNASVTTKFEIRNSNFAIPLKGNEGFTLIEVILVIIVIGALAGILIAPLQQGVTSFATTEVRADLAAQAREAGERMIREMRNIQRKANDKPNVTSADATSVTFVDIWGTTISYSLSGSTVLRDSNTLADNVSTFQLRYFDGSNTELTSFPLIGTDREKVRRILVVLTFQDNGETVTITRQAFLRDMKGF